MEGKTRTYVEQDMKRCYFVGVSENGMSAVSQPNGSVVGKRGEHDENPREKRCYAYWSLNLRIHGT
jgi:hypothetical protein